MKFDPRAPLDSSIVSRAKIFHDFVSNTGGSIKAMYLHWPVESFGCKDGAYNFGVRLDGNSRWEMSVWHNPEPNAYEPPADGYAAHTWHRNGQAVGCAIQGMAGATTADFGRYGIQAHELENFLAMCAAVALRYTLDANDPSVVMTHAEAAIHDGYFPGDGDPDSRWDLAILTAGDPVTKEGAIATANGLRERIHLYKLELMK